MKNNHPKFTIYVDYAGYNSDKTVACLMKITKKGKFKILDMANWPLSAKKNEKWEKMINAQ